MCASPFGVSSGKASPSRVAYSSSKRRTRAGAEFNLKFSSVQPEISFTRGSGELGHVNYGMQEAEMDFYSGLILSTEKAVFLKSHFQVF